MVKNPPVNAGDTREQVPPLGQEDPLEQEMVTRSYSVNGMRTGRTSLASHPVPTYPSLSFSRSHTCSSYGNATGSVKQSENQVQISVLLTVGLSPLVDYKIKTVVGISNLENKNKSALHELMAR